MAYSFTNAAPSGPLGSFGTSTATAAVAPRMAKVAASHRGATSAPAPLSQHHQQPTRRKSRR